ncbi:DUF6705 family protein, partial [Chryseobacterium echinoideorum]|uniref:DUF6705 family protein n=1 Tax=Chryseobacterium echinoideorum TaxID=1549648 RepID=UPI001185B6C7
MKNTKIIIILFVLVNLINCKAQQTFPLNTDYRNIPDYSYIKDLNNELNQFAGIYKANYQGNEITLYINKIENKLEDGSKKKYYNDALVIKYQVKNLSGSILQSTLNLSDSNNEFTSIWSAPNENAVVLHYPGTNCGVGWGRVFLFKISSTQLSWEYRPEG